MHPFLSKIYYIKAQKQSFPIHIFFYFVLSYFLFYNHTYHNVSNIATIFWVTIVPQWCWISTMFKCWRGGVASIKMNMCCCNLNMASSASFWDGRRLYKNECNWMTMTIRGDIEMMSGRHHTQWMLVCNEYETAREQDPQIIVKMVSNSFSAFLNTISSFCSALKS